MYRRGIVRPMTAPPEKLLVPPNSLKTVMDALSDLLRVVRLSGGVFLDAEFSAPWSITAQVGPEDCRFVLAEPARLIAFHYVISGKLLLQIDRDPPVEVRGGSIVLLPRNDAHTLASQPGLKPVSAEHVDSDGSRRRIGAHSAWRWRGGNADRLRLCRKRSGLPPADRCAAVNARPRSQRQGRGRMDLQLIPLCRSGTGRCSRRFGNSAGEAFGIDVRGSRSVLPGSASCGRARMACGTARSGCGESSRACCTRNSPGPGPRRSWPDEVYLSRSAFADRFTALIGMPPITYLTRWRMQVAAQRLRESRRSVAQISADVGYESEIAFARAFKRQFSMSPAQWRKERPS